jgi:hypothetical protein
LLHSTELYLLKYIKLRVQRHSVAGTSKQDEKELVLYRIILLEYFKILSVTLTLAKRISVLKGLSAKAGPWPDPLTLWIWDGNGRFIRSQDLGDLGDRRQSP